MSAPISPGDWVECVDTRGDDDIVPLGSIHLVEDVGVLGVTPWLILKGITHPSGLRKARADCFRPVYRPRADFIESLKAPPVVAPSDLEHA